MSRRPSNPVEYARHMRGRILDLPSAYHDRVLDQLADMRELPYRIARAQAQINGGKHSAEVEAVDPA